MKVGYHFVDFIDHVGDYAMYLLRIMTHVVIHYLMLFILFDILALLF